jgi:hypothetical protein
MKKYETFTTAQDAADAINARLGQRHAKVVRVSDDPRDGYALSRLPYPFCRRPDDCLQRLGGIP